MSHYVTFDWLGCAEVHPDNGRVSFTKYAESTFGAAFLCGLLALAPPSNDDDDGGDLPAILCLGKAASGVRYFYKNGQLDRMTRGLLFGPVSGLLESQDREAADIRAWPLLVAKRCSAYLRHKEKYGRLCPL